MLVFSKLRYIFFVSILSLEKKSIPYSKLEKLGYTHKKISSILVSKETQTLHCHNNLFLR
jgi:hypothetical protein